MISRSLGGPGAALVILASALASAWTTTSYASDPMFYGLDTNRSLTSDSTFTRPLGATVTFDFCYPVALPVIGQGTWRGNMDFAMQVANAQGLDMVITLSSALRMGGDALPPPDTLLWQDSVAAVVERYDGDGKSDMPGLTRPVRYWHVEQEMTFWTGTWDQYASHLGATSRAIRRADPAAIVVTIGLNSKPLWGNANRAGFVLLPPSANQFVAPTQLDQNETALTKILAAPGYDIVDMHSYEEKSIITGKVAYVRTFMPDPTKPVWCLESAGPFLTRAQGYTDTLNAAAVVRQVTEALGAGIGYYSWSLLQFTSGEFNTEIWNNMPLTRMVGTVPVTKPSYAAYQQMVGKLRNTTLLGDASVRTQDEDHIVFVERFSRNPGIMAVLWCNHDSAFAYATTATAVSVTKVITKAGQTTSKPDTLYASNGKVNLTVGQVPVYVEDLSYAVALPPPAGAPAIPAVRALRQRGGWDILWSAPHAPRGLTVSVFDVRGAVVARLNADGRASDAGQAFWGGLDERGRRAARGVYTIRVGSRTGVIGSARAVLTD